MAEARPDTEQSEKCQEIIDILIAAGYFRARIKGLSPFDKIVGGMVYCIEALNEDVDVDLLFNDSLTIGQKISLTEKIVVVLPRISCPYMIEPHQIQGLDYINIFPVVQWLVKRSVENRTENAGRLKKFAIDQFHNDFNLQSSVNIAAARECMSVNVDQLSHVFHPKRKFRKFTTDAVEEERAQVQLTILEYGNEAFVATKSKQPIRQRSSSTSEVEYSSIDLNVLLKNMSLADEIDNKIEQVYDFDEEVRDTVFNEYSNLVTEFAKDDKEVEKQKQIKHLQNAKENLEKRLELLKIETVAIMQKKEEKILEINQAKIRQDEIQSEFAALKGKHASQDKDLIAKLTELVRQIEDLKMCESKFKKDCTEEMQKMKAKVMELKTASENGDDEKLELLENETKDLNAIRLKLARKNRHIVVLQRQLDNIPGRSELAQYQRRFLELYNQVSAKHRETKQFYTLYNTLGDTKLYMEKEINLLNSISENFSTTITGNPVLRAQFLKQFEQIVVGVKENKTKLQKRCSDEKQKKERLNQELASLFELQRKYAVAIKDFRQMMQEKSVKPQISEYTEQNEEIER